MILHIYIVWRKIFVEVQKTAYAFHLSGLNVQLKF